jgi:uncharacterized protein YunC (DUF1805 family)
VSAAKPACPASLAERGSVLVLMPAAVLILLVLAAIAVDFAVIFLGEQEAADAAAAAANDAVVAAIGEQRFYTCGQLALDLATAEKVAAQAIEARTADSVATAKVRVDIGSTAAGVPEATVTVTGTVNLIFASAIPGASRTAEVSATSVATAEQDPTVAPVEGTCP